MTQNTVNNRNIINGSDEFPDPNGSDDDDEEDDTEIVADPLDGMLYFLQRRLAKERARRDNTLRRKDDHAH